MEQREFYRLTNAAMSNFNTRRKMLNEFIRADLVTQQGAIDKFIAELKDARLIK
jgi:hypothetical protein